MESSDPTSRLTEREKEALRGWLDHKTAKEIAIDLGVSHHAIEKRLKMARTKLDADTSLEAARILAEAERYGLAVADPPDLQAEAKTSNLMSLPIILIGGFLMIITTLIAFALAPSQMAATTHTVTGGEIEINGSSQRLFESLDKDSSGYLEQPESPFVTLAFVDPGGEQTMEGKAVLGDGSNTEDMLEFYVQADADEDGRVSFSEFDKWHEARLAEMGIKISTVVKVIPIPES